MFDTTPEPISDPTPEAIFDPIVILQPHLIGIWNVFFCIFISNNYILFLNVISIKTGPKVNPPTDPIQEPTNEPNAAQIYKICKDLIIKILMN